MLYGSRRSRLSRLLLATPLLLACGTAPMDSTGGSGTPPGTMPDSLVPWAFQESTPWGSGGSDDGTLVTRPVAAPPSGDYELTVSLRFDQPSESDDPIHETSAFAVYRANGDLGGYEGVLVLRQSGGDEYRLMLSAHWGEALLWSSRGGILQVKPFAFTTARDYALRATVAGQQITLTVDGQTLIDHRDTTAPLSRGAVALGRRDGLTTFGPVALRTITAPAAPAATPHKPQFAFRKWKKIDWAFDGDEPIFAVGYSPGYANTFLPRVHSCTLFEVKLVPGYTPQIYVPWYPQNWTSEAFMLSDLRERLVQEEGDRLRFSLRCYDPALRPDLEATSQVTLTYDPTKNVYVYDSQTTLTVPKGQSVRVDTPIDVIDPGIYNGVQSGSPQGVTWPQPHPNSVYLQEEGKLYRQPHNHMGWYPGYGKQPWFEARMNYLQLDRGYWSVVGDPVANPVFQFTAQPPVGKYPVQMCDWGYDLHLSWEPGPVLNAGSYQLNWRITSNNGATSDALLKQATYALPTDLSATWLLYTGGVGHVERFDKVVPKASPFGEYVWGEGALQDTTVGHGDKSSLRFIGPGYASSSAGESRFGESFLPDTDYEVSVWVKTKDAVGQGPGMYLGDQSYYPGITGTNDWRRIGFVVRPSAPLNVQTFGLHNAGAGTVWFDDFQIRAVTADNPADPTSAKAPRPLTQVGTPDPQRTLLWNSASESADGTVLDQSGWGNHGALVSGARWVADSDPKTGKALRVIELPGGAAQALLRGYPALDLGSSVTVSLWFKPTDNTDTVLTLLSGGIEDTDLWRVNLLGDGAPWLLRAELLNSALNTNPLVSQGAWSHLAMTHDGATLNIYLNGARLQQSNAPMGRWLGLGAEGFLRVGSGRWEGNVMAPLSARVARLQVQPRVLSAAEVAAAAAAGVAGP